MGKNRYKKGFWKLSNLNKIILGTDSLTKYALRIKKYNPWVFKQFALILVCFKTTVREIKDNLS